LEFNDEATEWMFGEAKDIGSCEKEESVTCRMSTEESDLKRGGLSRLAPMITASFLPLGILKELDP
jgi:hypothetical protein